MRLLAFVHLLLWTSTHDRPQLVATTQAFVFPQYAHPYKRLRKPSSRTSAVRSTRTRSWASTTTIAANERLIQKLQDDLESTQRQRTAMQKEIQKLRDELQTSQQKQRSVIEQELQQYESAVEARKKLLDNTEEEILSKLDQAEADMIRKMQSLERAESVTTSGSGSLDSVGASENVIDLGAAAPFLVLPLAVIAVGRSMLEDAQLKRQRLEREQRSAAQQQQALKENAGIGGVLKPILGGAVGLVLTFTILTTIGPLSETETPTAVIDQQVVVMPTDSSSAASRENDSASRGIISAPSKEDARPDIIPIPEGPSSGNKATAENKAILTLPEPTMPTKAASGVGGDAAAETSSAVKKPETTKESASVSKSPSTFSLPSFDAPVTKRDIDNVPVTTSEEVPSKSEKKVFSEAPVDKQVTSAGTESDTSDASPDMEKKVLGFSLPSSATDSVIEKRSMSAETLSKEGSEKQSTEAPSSPEKDIETSVKQEKANEDDTTSAASKKHVPSFSLPSFDAPPAPDKSALEEKSMSVHTREAGRVPDKESAEGPTSSEKRRTVEEQDPAGGRTAADEASMTKVPNLSLPSFGTPPGAVDNGNGEESLPAEAKREESPPSKQGPASAGSTLAKDPKSIDKKGSSEESVVTSDSTRLFSGFNLPSFDAPAAAVERGKLEELAQKETLKEGPIPRSDASESSVSSTATGVDNREIFTENPASIKDKESLSKHSPTEIMRSRIQTKESTVSEQERTVPVETVTKQMMTHGPTAAGVEGTMPGETRPPEHAQEKAAPSAQLTERKSTQETTNVAGGKLDPPKAFSPKNDPSQLNVHNSDVHNLPTVELPKFKLIDRSLDSFDPLTLGIGGVATMVSLGAMALAAKQNDATSALQDDEASTKTVPVKTEVVAPVKVVASEPEPIDRKSYVEPEFQPPPTQQSTLEPIDLEAKAATVEQDETELSEIACTAEEVETDDDSASETSVVEGQRIETAPFTVEQEAPMANNGSSEAKLTPELERVTPRVDDVVERESAEVEPQSVSEPPVVESQPTETYRLQLKLELDQPFTSGDEFELKVVDVKHNTAPAEKERAQTDQEQTDAPLVEAERVFESVPRKLDVVEAEMVETESTQSEDPESEVRKAERMLSEPNPDRTPPNGPARDGKSDSNGTSAVINEENEPWS